MRECSVIIPTLNRPAMVCQLITHLRRKLCWSCPIIVVDQSDDKGAELLERLATDPLPLLVRHMPQNERGTGLARNAGARLADTTWLLFLDDDVFPARGFDKRLNEAIVMHPWVDGFALGLRSADDWDEYVRLCMPEMPTWGMASYERHTRPPEWNAVSWFIRSVWGNHPCMSIGLPSGNFAIKREAFLKVGGFDENIQGMGDDCELGLRLWWYGWRLLHYPLAVAFHLRHPAGGLRPVAGGQESWWHRLVRPEPSPGSLYLYLHWFPGKPTKQMLVERVLDCLLHPIRKRFPVCLVRLWLAWREAKRLAMQGPKYVNGAPPQIRPDES